MGTDSFKGKLIFEENGSRKKFVPRFTDVL